MCHLPQIILTWRKCFLSAALERCSLFLKINAAESSWRRFGTHGASDLHPPEQQQFVKTPPNGLQPHPLVPALQVPLFLLGLLKNTYPVRRQHKPCKDQKRDPHNEGWLSFGEIFIAFGSMFLHQLVVNDLHNVLHLPLTVDVCFCMGCLGVLTHMGAMGSLERIVEKSGCIFTLHSNL